MGQREVSLATTVPETKKSRPDYKDVTRACNKTDVVTLTDFMKNLFPDDVVVGCDAVYTCNRA
jgi:hypothetical protein